MTHYPNEVEMQYLTVSVTLNNLSSELDQEFGHIF